MKNKLKIKLKMFDDVYIIMNFGFLVRLRLFAPYPSYCVANVFNNSPVRELGFLTRPDSYNAVIGLYV